MISLTLLCGLPGSGKSTVCKRLTRDSYVVLCPDDFRKILTGKNFHGPAEEMVWSHVKVAARALLMQRQVVAIDATAISPGSRAQWISLAKEIDPEASVYCHVILTSYSECLKRNAGREERFVPEFIMGKQRDKFVLPTLDEGFSMIEFFDGEGDEIGSASIDPEDGSTWLYDRAEELIALGNPYSVREFLEG